MEYGLLRCVLVASIRLSRFLRLFLLLRALRSTPSLQLAIRFALASPRRLRRQCRASSRPCRVHPLPIRRVSASVSPRVGPGAVGRSSFGDSVAPPPRRLIRFIADAAAGFPVGVGRDSAGGPPTGMRADDAGVTVPPSRGSGAPPHWSSESARAPHVRRYADGTVHTPQLPREYWSHEGPLPPTTRHSALNESATTQRPGRCSRRPWPRSTESTRNDESRLRRLGSRSNDRRRRLPSTTPASCATPTANSLSPALLSGGRPPPASKNPRRRTHVLLLQAARPTRRARDFGSSCSALSLCRCRQVDRTRRLVIRFT